jgi:hypothetical protein
MKSDKKQIYALTYCYEGGDNIPRALTLAVSDDRQKLVAKMEEYIKDDIQVDEKDEWREDHNFIVYEKHLDKVILQHRYKTDLYVTYEIRLTEQI